MHIVYLIHQFFPRHVGGVEVYTLGLAKYAIAAKHQVTVIAYHESPSASSSDFGVIYTSYENIPIVEIHYNLSTAPRPMQYEYDNFFVAHTLSDILLNLKPDLVHVMHAMKLSVSALNVCDQLQIPFIVTLCDFWFICPRHTLLKWNQELCNGPVHNLYCVRCIQELHGFVKHPHILRDASDLYKRNKFVKNALLKACRIIALSDFQKNMYVRNGLPAQRIEVIQHGPDQVLVKKEAREKNKPYQIGYIGSLVEHKGIHILFEALARLPDIEIQCKIYGSLNDSMYVKRLLKYAEHDSRIQFMGTFDPTKMLEVIHSIDILVMPAIWYENEPLVVKSALQAGVPVLCSDIGSLSDMVKHNETGWLVPFGDVHAWVNAIENVMEQFADFQMKLVYVKTMEENVNEIFSIYDEEIK